MKQNSAYQKLCIELYKIGISIRDVKTELERIQACVALVRDCIKDLYEKELLRKGKLKAKKK